MLSLCLKNMCTANILEQYSNLKICFFCSSQRALVGGFPIEIFYFEDFGQFATYLTSMFTLKNGIIGGDTLSTILMYLPILIVTAMASLPIWKNTYLKLKDKKYMGVLEIAFCAVVIVLCTASLVNQSYNPFLYFRF